MRAGGILQGRLNTAALRVELSADARPESNWLCALPTRWVFTETQHPHARTAWKPPDWSRGKKLHALRSRRCEWSTGSLNRSVTNGRSSPAKSGHPLLARDFLNGRSPFSLGLVSITVRQHQKPPRLPAANWSGEQLTRFKTLKTYMRRLNK